VNVLLVPAHPDSPRRNLESSEMVADLQ